MLSTSSGLASLALDLFRWEGLRHAVRGWGLGGRSGGKGRDTGTRSLGVPVLLSLLLSQPELLSFQFFLQLSDLQLGIDHPFPQGFHLLHVHISFPADLLPARLQLPNHLHQPHLPILPLHNLVLTVLDMHPQFLALVVERALPRLLSVLQLEDVPPEGFVLRFELNDVGLETGHQL